MAYGFPPSFEQVYTSVMSTPSAHSSFSHHKTAGWFTMAIVMGALVLLEGGLVHLWLARSGYVAALWIVSGLHTVALAWIAADAMALATRRTNVYAPSDGAPAVVDVRVGLRVRARFAVNRVSQVQVGSFEACEPTECLVALTGQANVRLTFASPIQVHTPWSSPRPVTALLLQVDEPTAFQRALFARA